MTNSKRIFIGCLAGSLGMAGLDDLFDEDHCARIRANGIEPASGRDYCAGFSLSL